VHSCRISVHSCCYHVRKSRIVAVAMTMKRVLAINGSTREKGNTDTILASFSEGVNKGGLNVQTAILRGLTLNDCIGCCQCQREGTCYFVDDMTHLRNMIVKSDVLVFASPNYWCEITGVMKTFIDRLYFFHHKENSEMIAGKKAIIITTLGEKDADYECQVLVEFYKRCLHSLRIEVIDWLFFPDLMEKQAISAKSEYLKQAFTAGKALSRIS
jgi:multimeric flavodoxin WrbA